MLDVSHHISINIFDSEWTRWHLWLRNLWQKVRDRVAEAKPCQIPFLSRLFWVEWAVPLFHMSVAQNGEKGAYTKEALKFLRRFWYRKPFDGYHSLQRNWNSSRINNKAEPRKRRSSNLILFAIKKESCVLYSLKETTQVPHVILLIFTTHDYIIHVYEVYEWQIFE